MTRKKVRCPGTGTRTGGWPGDQDTCPICQQWVTVRQDETLRAHYVTAPKAAPPARPAGPTCEADFLCGAPATGTRTITVPACARHADQEPAA